MSPKTKIQNKWRFSIDRGGTFTDIIGYDLFGNIKTFKVLSGNDPKRGNDPGPLHPR